MPTTTEPTSDCITGATSYTTGHPMFGPAIQARRRYITERAECESCGATRSLCEHLRETNTDKTAPEWFGCCAQGLDLRPCRHAESAELTRALLDEIEAGAVRTVEAAHPARIRDERHARLKAFEAAFEAKKVSILWLLDQRDVWQPEHGPMLRIDGMTDTHRWHTLHWLERRASSLEFAYSLSVVSMGDDVPECVWAEVDRDAADPAGWLKRTPLYRALSTGLPSPDGKKKECARFEDMIARAKHWSTCPRNRDLGADSCTCERNR